MASSEFIQLREQIAAESKALHAITSTLGADMNVDAVLKAGLIPGATTSADVAADVQKRSKALADLDVKFKPYRDLEAASTLATEYEKRFAKPAAAAGITMPGGKIETDPKTPVLNLGAAFVGSRAYKAWQDHKAIEVADVVSLDLRATLFQTSAGWPVESPAPIQTQVMPKEPAQNILSRIPFVRYGEAIYSYMEETTHTDNTAEAAEDAVYGESAFALTKREKNIRKVANSLPVTDEQLADVNGAEDFVRGRLEYQLRFRLGKQALAGSGVSPNIEGTESVTGIQTQAVGLDSTEDAIFKLLTSIRTDGWAEPEVVFLNPAKWSPIRLRKTNDGIYLYGPPSMSGPETLWGLPLVQTAAHTSTKAIAGAYGAFSLMAVKQDVEFALGYINTQFVKGEKTIRADVRVAMVHLRPKAFGVVTGL